MTSLDGCDTSRPTKAIAASLIRIISFITRPIPAEEEVDFGMRINRYRDTLPAAVLTAATALAAYGGRGATAGMPPTITQNEPPPSAGYWTSGRMERAKPMPLPNLDEPPAPIRPGANPFAQPPGHSLPGSGAREPR